MAGAPRAGTWNGSQREPRAATIELSLNSPTFLKIGPSAHELLGVAAFFLQGIDINNLHWFRLFPTIPDIKNAFDKFNTLSFTHRIDNFTPIRDYLRVQNPTSARLLSATNDRYLSRGKLGRYLERLPPLYEAPLLA